LASGNHRIVYSDPRDPSRVIKVPKNGRSVRPDNLIESLYLKHMKKKGKSLLYVTDFFGWVDTDLGRGAIFERIKDFNGADSVSLKQWIDGSFERIELGKTLLEELGKYLLKNRVVFADPSLGNLLIQEYEPEHFRLRIIDGLGGRHMDKKFKMTLASSLYEGVRAKKQWRKLLDTWEKATLQGLER